MPTERKVATVASLVDKMSRMQLAVVADYRGMTVAEMGDMRARLREHGADVVIAKNTLLRIAARETGNQTLEPALEGPTAVAFAYDDVSKVAKVFQNYVKENSKVSVRGVLLGTSLIQEDGLEQVTKLPSREQVLAQIVGGVQSPLTGLVGIVNAPVSDVYGIINAAVSNVAYVLQARIDQLQADAPAS